ncbi:MAG TPA: Zn-dependent hydrolase [Gammaproteobacteria bacterium]|nr:Zn-dependent hydrolase [Gammaproteobacteria bacterium]
MTTQQNSPQPAINLARLKRDLEELSRIGYDASDGGINRLSFSDADMRARRWLIDRLDAIGLDAGMDGAANVIGRWEVGEGPALMVGSHLDSVPSGGMFDGALGVVAGLECVHTLKESGLEPGHPIEVVATSEEEGRFGGMFGAQALCGEVTRDQLENSRDEAGTSLREAMERQGLDPEEALRAARAPDSLAAFLELHVEQGPVLEAAGKPIGIVEGISGVFNWTVTLTGTANHAGTTPMNLRHDAFMGLVDFAGKIPQMISTLGNETSRLTIGRVEVSPGFAHTVPGRVEFTLVGRDMDEEVMTRLAKECAATLEAVTDHHGLELERRETSWLAPRPCHPDIIQAFQQQADKLGLDSMVMPSGAGHDTQFMTGITRAGMIFVPSKDGISHAPGEWTEWTDVETGANLLLHTLYHLSMGRSQC